MTPPHKEHKLNHVHTVFANTVKLYPNKAQAQLLRRSCGCRRYVYNHFLKLQQARYSEHKAGKAERGFISYTEMCKMLTALKAAPETSWLQEVNAHTLQQTLKDLETAFKRFFTGKAKYPVFKRKGCRDGFMVPDACAVSEDMRHVWICKFGWVRCRGLRPAVLRPNGNSEFYSVQSVTVRAVADWFEAAVLFRVDAVAHEHASPRSSCGLDIGISKPAAVVDDIGAEVTYGVAEQERLRRNDIKLRRWQRKLARQQKGSASRQRTKNKVARAQHRAACIRRDYAHKISHKLATTYNTVVVEDLNIRGMTASAAGTVEAPGRNVKQKSGLNREMLRLAPTQLVTMLKYKCRRAGGQLVRVNPAFTSQTCSACGTVDSRSRENQATFRCVHCGHTGNADFNAAQNIRRLGLKTVGATVVEGPCPGEAEAARSLASWQFKSGTTTICALYALLVSSCPLTYHAQQAREVLSGAASESDGDIAGSKITMRVVRIGHQRVSWD